MIAHRYSRSSRGFSLVEVTLALGVAAFCLLALFGLLPIGVSSNQTTVEQTAAASAAASIVADLRSTTLVTTPPGAPSPTPPLSKQFSIPVPPASNPYIYTLYLKDDGSMAQDPTKTVTSATAGWDADLKRSPRYRVTLVFSPLPSGQPGAMPVRVLVTWPAVADPKAATSLTQNFPSQFSGSFETVTALGRN